MPFIEIFYRRMGAIWLLILIKTPMVVSGQAFSGFEQHAYAGATVSLPTAAFVLSANPAAISGHSLHWFGTRHFGLSALQEGGLSYQRNLQSESFEGGYALELHHFGFSLYRELQAKSGVALQVDHARFGFGAGILHNAIEGYDTAYSIVVDTGFQYRLSGRLLLGAALKNYPLWDAGSFKPGVLSSATAGLSYTPENGLLMSLAVEQTDRFQPDIHAGISYAFEPIPDTITVLGVAGYSSIFEVWSGGLALQLYSVKVTYSFRDHPQLGLTHGLGFGFVW
ncbi:MAG: hypothetical protein JJU41_08660 [Bacteroidetes bacterium]|nr:hypothetical protein [Bacteroidota bacterium]